MPSAEALKFIEQEAGMNKATSLCAQVERNAGRCREIWMWSCGLKAASSIWRLCVKKHFTACVGVLRVIMQGNRGGARASVWSRSLNRCEQIMHQTVVIWPFGIFEPVFGCALQTQNKVLLGLGIVRDWLGVLGMLGVVVVPRWFYVHPRFILCSAWSFCLVTTDCAAILQQDRLGKHNEALPAAA